VIGRALRDAARDERLGAILCTCGHSAFEHREWASTWVIVYGEIVELRHPNYRPAVFHCQLCDCPSLTKVGV